MSTSTDRTHYRELVAQVAAKAKAILPQEVNGRVESAVKLVLSGDVEPQADGSIHVGSSSDPAKTYHLIGTACTCQDFQHAQAPQGWCQHRIAAGIAKRVREVLATLPTPPPTAPVAPLPEAPASVNVRLMVQGREVQWTLSDTDEARLAARLEALLARYPVLTSPSVQPTKNCPSMGTVLPEATTRECPAHPGVLMVEQHNARGAWWSHRQADGTWCKGKGSRP